VYYILGNIEVGFTGNRSPENTVILTKYIEKCSLNTFGIVLIVVGAISIHIYDEAKHKPDCFDELKSTPGGLQSSIANQNLLLLAQVALAYGIWNILVGSVGVIMIVYDTIKYCLPTNTVTPLEQNRRRRRSSQDRKGRYLKVPDVQPNGLGDPAAITINGLHVPTQAPHARTHTSDGDPAAIPSGGSN
jgi:hypothetical protein